MSAETLLPLPAKAAIPDTLDELMVRIELELTPRIDAGSTAAYWERNGLRTLCRLVAILLVTLAVRIEQIVELTKADYIRGLGCTPKRATALVCAQKRLLKYAASYDWTCEAYRRWQAWEPVREALRAGKGEPGNLGTGNLGIITFAYRRGYWPETFSDAVMENWKLDKKEKEQSLYTIDTEESMFRKKLRTRLQPLFPHFDLRRRNPRWYRLPLHKMTGELREQVVGIVHAREKGCNVDSRIRAITAHHLMRTLLAFLGYCTYVLGICRITSIRQVLTPEIIKDILAWLRDVRGCRWLTIYTMLNRVYYLTQLGHPPFAGSGEEYAWFEALLQQIPHEPKAELRERKIARRVTYERFTQIAVEIGKVLQTNQDLTPFRRGILYRDFYFCTAIASHPWRGRNWKECRIDPDTLPNIKYMTIPSRVRRDGKLPLWVQQILNDKSDQEFWVCHYVEIETKAKNEIWEVFEPELVKVFLEYCNVHRKEILGKRQDPGTLLINNAGRPMTGSQLGKRLTVLSRQYIGKPVSPHIVRDIVAEHAVLCGCTLESVQEMLWHKYRSSKTTYLSGLNNSHACGALETEFAA